MSPYGCLSMFCYVHISSCLLVLHCTSAIPLLTAMCTEATVASSTNQSSHSVIEGTPSLVFTSHASLPTARYTLMIVTFPSHMAVVPEWKKRMISFLSLGGKWISCLAACSAFHMCNTKLANTVYWDFSLFAVPRLHRWMLLTLPRTQKDDISLFLLLICSCLLHIFFPFAHV